MSAETTPETPEQITAYIALGKLVAEWEGDIHRWANDYRENLRAKYPAAAPEVIYDERKELDKFRLLFLDAVEAADAADDAAEAAQEKP